MCGRLNASLLPLVIACVVAGRTAVPDVSALGLVLGRHQLDDVVAALGPAKIVRTGDAGESEASVCYRTAKGEVLAFVSYTEMATGLELTAIRLGGAQALHGECSPLKQPLPRLSNGLRLGMTRAQIEAALGVALQEAPEGFQYSICSPEPFEKGTDDYDRWANTKCFPEGVVPHADICTSVTVRLRKGRAVLLEVSRIEAVC